MTLIKTGFLNAAAVTLKMLTMMGLNKVLAIYVGPAGYVAIGNFQNAIQIITTFASGAINTGVVKYTAEYNDSEDKLKKLWQTAGTICLIGSVISGVMVFLFSKQIAFWFLKDESYSFVFNWFAIVIFFSVFNTLLFAVLIGKKQVVLYVLCNIFGSIFSLVITGILAVNFGLKGALTALAIHPALSSIVTFLLCYRAGFFRIRFFFGCIDRGVIVRLTKYTAMALISTACVPVVHIMIRGHIAATLGDAPAGQWEAMCRVSNACFMLVTSTLNIYYLPRLSELKETSLIMREIRHGYKTVLPIVAVFCVVLFLFRDMVVKALFTSEFGPMRELFGWQMLGEFLKIGSWILGNLMLGKAMVKLFIFSEIIFYASFFAWIYVFTKMFGLKGVGAAYALNYGIYWIAIYFAIKNNLRKNSF